MAIANAGFGVVGPLRKLSLDDYRRQFETNVFGVLRTIYAALPEIEKTAATSRSWEAYRDGEPLRELRPTP